MLRSFIMALAIALLSFAPAHAATVPHDPDLLSVSVGYWDFEKQEVRQAADFRLEYRWGYNIFPASWAPYVQMHPFAGLEATTQDMFFGLGGFAFDFPIGNRVYITWSEGVGAVVNEGEQPFPLGSVIEFRSQAELGVKFDNQMRLGGSVSHISNAGIGGRNPGAEIASLYLHLPVSMIFKGSR